VCTNGRDTVDVSWWLTSTRHSSFKANTCNQLSHSRCQISVLCEITHLQHTLFFSYQMNWNKNEQSSWRQEISTEIDRLKQMFSPFQHKKQAGVFKWFPGCSFRSRPFPLQHPTQLRRAKMEWRRKANCILIQLTSVVRVRSGTFGSITDLLLAQTSGRFRSATGPFEKPKHN